MKNRIAIVISSAIVFAPLFRAMAGYVPIQPVIQEYSEWCWAASIMTTLNSFAKYPGVDIETDSTGYRGQCLVAQKLSPGSELDCCDDQDACFYSADEDEIVDILNGYPYYLHTSYTDDTISDSELSDYINLWKLPVIAITQYMYDDWKHAVVVTGVGTDATTVTIMDPAEGYYIALSMSEFLNGTSKKFPYRWTTTISWKKSDGIPMDVMSQDQKMIYTHIRPVSEKNKSYTFYSQDKTTTGPDFVVEKSAQFAISSVNSQRITLIKGSKIESGAKFCAKYGEKCTIP